MSKKRRTTKLRTSEVAASVPISRRSRQRDGSDRQGRDDLIEHGPSLDAHLVIGGVLNRVIDQHIARALHAQRLALGLGRLSKFAGGDGNGGKTLDFKPYSVVQTARRA